MDPAFRAWYTINLDDHRYLADPLGIAPDRLAALRQRYLWSNITDGQWSQLSIGLSLVLAVLTAWILRVPRRWPIMQVLVGTGVCVALLITVNLGLLLVGFVD